MHFHSMKSYQMMSLNYSEYLSK